jgi:hypothetical protein
MRRECNKSAFVFIREVFLVWCSRYLL